MQIEKIGATTNNVLWRFCCYSSTVGFGMQIVTYLEKKTSDLGI